MPIKSLLIWGVIAVGLVVLFGVMTGGQTPRNATELGYSALLQRVANNDIAAAETSGETIISRSKTGQNFITYLPQGTMPNVVDRLTAAHVDVATKQPKTGPGIGDILIGILPMLLLIGAWFFFMRQMQAGGRGAMGFGRSKARLLTENKNRVTFNYTYDAQGNLASLQNTSTGQFSRFGYSPGGPHLLTLVTTPGAQPGNAIFYAPLVQTAPLRADLGSADQFLTTTTQSSLAAGATERFAFSLRPSELRSAKAGAVLIGVEVRSSAGSSLHPAPPALTGFTPLVQRATATGSFALFAVNRDGLNLLDRVTGRFVRYGHDPTDPASLRDDYVMSLFQDRTGLLWVGTRAGGVSRWNPRSWAFGHLPTAVTHGAYSMAFEEDASGRLWVGTHGAGLLRVDPISSEVETAEQVFGQPRLLADRRVMALLRDRAGGLWIGTMGAGLVHVSARGVVRRYQHRDGDAGSLAADGVMALFQARDGRVWVGTYGGGVCIIDPLDGRVKRVAYDPRLDDALSSPRATAIAQGPDGTVWVGTDGGGLDALTESGAVLGAWRHDSRVPGSLAANTVYALHVDVRGRVWVGTDDGGLDRIVGSPRERGGVRFVNASTAEGLSSNTIYGIESGEDGALWLSGNQGLVRYDPDGGVVRRYHRENGLQREEFNFGAHHRLADGRLVFGGAGGFNLFDPASIGVQPVPPPAIVLTSVQVGGRAALSAAELNGLGSLSLGYRDQALTLEFAALDYTAPQRNQYSYRLRGLGDAWTASGSRRFVNFTGLDAGDYVLEVRAAGPDGVWNSAPFAP